MPRSQRETSHADHHCRLARIRRRRTPRRDHAGNREEVRIARHAGVARTWRGRAGRLSRCSLCRHRVCRCGFGRGAGRRVVVRATAVGCRDVLDEGRRGADRTTASAQRRRSAGHVRAAQTRRVLAGAVATHHARAGDGRIVVAGGRRGLPRDADRGRGCTEVLPDADDRRRHAASVESAGDRRGRRGFASDRDRAPAGRDGRRV